MLPSGNEPLVLADGTKIDPETGAVLRERNDVLIEVPNNAEMQREIVAARKRIVDLPIPPQQMNTLSVIMCYSLFGVTEQDIANILSLDIEQVRAVKMSDVYTSVQNELVENIIASDQSEVRDMFVANSKAAATRMTGLMNSDSEGVQMAAAKDVLDRAGQRPVDVVEHRHKVEGGLTIEYIKQTDDIPIIDVTPS